MNQRARRLAAIGPFVVTLAIVAADVPLLVLNSRSLSAEEGDFFVNGATLVSALVYGAVGLLIASRQPRNVIGRLFSVLSIGLTFTVGATQYAGRALVIEPGSLPFGTLAAWLQNWVPVPAIYAIVFVFLLFPTGRVPSPRWRPVLLATLANAVALTLAWFFRPGAINQSFGSLGSLGVDNPVGLGSTGGIVGGTLAVASIGAVTTGALAIASLVFRFRRASGEERQQIRWLALVGAAAAALFLFGMLLAGVATCENDPGSVCNAVSTIDFILFLLTLGLGIPIACGVAILRYRLWDLDVVIKKTVVYAILVVVLMAVFVVAVASTAGLLVGAVVVALIFQPMRERARRLADRVVYGKRATPYEVLTEFSGRMADTYATEDVLPRMAQILAGAVGATTARVWVRVGEQLRPTASFPEGDLPRVSTIGGDSLPAFQAGEHAVEVRDRGELLGALSVEMPANDPLTPARERLVTDLASQAGLVLRNVRLIEELRASRQRLVAAQDEERRRIERNIHDGAQQQLVALAVKLRLARATFAKDAGRADSMLQEAERETTEALEDLRDLARGIYPPLLADQGLAAALEAQARKAAVPTRVEADGVGRCPRDVESTVYFCVLEALNNVAKYADASGAVVALSRSDGRLTFEVRDDGAGFDLDLIAYGTGLQGMRDRIEAIGGTLSIASAPGAGTTVTGSVPSVAN